MKLLRLPLLALLTLSAAPLAGADVIIGNFGSGVGVGTAFGSGSTTVEKAFGFTMGPQAATLGEVELSLDLAGLAPNPVVSIWSDAAGPAVELIVLDAPLLPSGVADVVFTPPAPFLLQANTTYWLHLRSDPTSGPAFYWDGSSPATFPTGSASGIEYRWNGNVSTFYNRFEIRSADDLAAFCLPAGTNSAGTSVGLGGSSFSGPGSVHLEADGGPPGQFGYFLVGATVVDPGIAVSQGFLCLATPQGRYNGLGGVNSLGQFDAAGVLQSIVGGSSVGSGFDVPLALPTPPGGVIASGSTWHFQLWYRDGPASNFSSGLSVTFP